MNETPKRLAQQIVRYYTSGNSLSKTAKKFGVRQERAKGVLLAAGVKVETLAEFRQRIRKLPPDDELKNLYQSGLSLSAIARRYGATLFGVRDALEKAGVARRRRGNVDRMFDADETARIIDLYRHLGSQTAVAHEIGTSQMSVCRVLRRAGITDGTKASGSRHGSWKGGRSMVHGYVQVLVDPADPLAGMRNSLGYVLEHRLVMARALGRPLSEHETVHHVNGDKKDNRLSNLQLRFGRHGNGVAMVCAKCGSHEIAYKELD